jgi:hypothetical protein
MKEKEQAPEYKKVDPNKCTHVGYFVPIGQNVFQISNSNIYEIIISKMCIRCGGVFTEKRSMLSIVYVEPVKEERPIMKTEEIKETEEEPKGIDLHAFYKIHPGKRKYKKRMPVGRPKMFYNTKSKKIIPRFP